MSDISFRKNGDGTIEVRVHAGGVDNAPGANPGSIEYSGTIAAADWASITAGITAASPGDTEKFYKHSRNVTGKLSPKK